jgi:osmotically-inducible protein OsmY
MNMANKRGRQDHYGDRDFEDRRRSRQQGGDYGRAQQQGERFSGDFRQGERSYGGSQGSWGSGQAGGWQSSGDYGSSGGYRGSGEGRFASGGRDYESDRGDDWTSRGSFSGGGEYADWQDRDRWQGRGGYYGERYGASGSSRGYGSERGYREGDRDFWDKAGDEVSSWFGDEDARRRREMDRYRGRGPRNYARSDERIREDVNDRLTDDGFLDATEIECSVENREVTLSGTVDSRQAKRRAEDLAESVSGVTHVQNNLRVRREDDTTSGSTVSSTSATTGSRTRKTTGM